ncbi:hypothetical protein JAAARDRAFT_191947 [Jaapia argillacea MUCL 33604]|uniref:Uncharacterized protein n=1 Tax=Jaapia argillacea MUCL 33604 TaxID=933084 RepID=A0A067Q7H7_9AGAM|nr:hypothetical protein JAAARDRAFT_191947 [Jaapia argillacea MUCL 33604]
MVHLVLYSPRGNSSSRFFPYHGYLGLTPLRVDGVVRTRLDEDAKLLPATSLTVTVKCCESRLGRVGVLYSNVLEEFSQLLWKKRDGVDYEELGDSEYAFRIIIPPNAGGPSTTHFQDYRVFWRIEAVLNHAPISGVGARMQKSFELPLIRYDVRGPMSDPSSSSLSAPPLRTPTLSSPSRYSSSSHTSHPQLSSSQAAPAKLRTYPIRYHIEAPSNPIGPSDLVSVGVWVRPGEEGVSVKSASLSVERRLEVRDGFGPPSMIMQSASESSAELNVPTASSGASSLATPAPSPSSSHQPTPSVSSSYRGSSTATIDTVDTITSTSPLLPATSRSSSTSSTLTLTTTTSPTTPSDGGRTGGALLSLPSPPSSTAPSPLASPSLPHSSSYSSLSSTSSTSKVHVTTIASLSSTHLTFDPQTCVFNKTLTVQWPSARSFSRWGLGESMNATLGEVKFIVRVKLTLTTPYGTDHLDLDYHPELLIVSTNEAERQLALAKYTETQVRPKSKSKSPRRSARQLNHHDNDVEPLPSPPGTPASGTRKEDNSSSSSSSSLEAYYNGSMPFAGGVGLPSSPTLSYTPTSHSRLTSKPLKSNSTSGHGGTREREREREREAKKKQAPGMGRRPHTSAGVSHSHGQREDRSFFGAPPPGLGGSADRPGAMDWWSVGNEMGEISRPSRERERRDRTESTVSAKTTGSTHTTASARSRSSRGALVQQPPLVQRPTRKVEGERERREREWEEELARIENQSRRSSADMLGFGLRKLKKAVGLGSAGG